MSLFPGQAIPVTHLFLNLYNTRNCFCSAAVPHPRPECRRDVDVPNRKSHFEAMKEFSCDGQITFVVSVEGKVQS